MKLVNRKNIGFFSALVAILFLIGCGKNAPNTAEIDREADMRARLDTANRLMFAGQMEKALAKLEVLHRDFPQNTDVIEALGFAYAKQKDYALAGFYFDQVLTTDPSRTDIALYSGKAHLQAENWEFAANAYSLFLQDNPNDFVAWKALAQANYELGKIKPTLDAYLNAFSNADNSPNPEEGARIGSLFLRLNNHSQAAEWFNYTLKFTPHQPEYQAQSLIGLLEIAWQEKNWQQAEQIIKDLDKIAPKALDQSPLAHTREAIKTSKVAHNNLKQQPVLNALEARAEQEQTQPTTAPPSTQADLESTQATETDTSDQLETAATQPSELATDESPLIEITASNDESEIFTKFPLIAEAGETEVAFENSSIDEIETPPSTAPLMDGRITIDREPAIELTDEELDPEPEPMSGFEIAKSFQEDGDYSMAISLFQAILVNNPTSSEACFELSRTYFLIESWSAAELYASEAMRLDPDSVIYTINFLKCVQKGKNQERLLKELVRAKEKFPESPEITLALAQGYDRIVRNPRNATVLYEEFLDIASLEHPSRSEAESALQQLSSR